jgi:hypothetical protein
MNRILRKRLQPILSKLDAVKLSVEELLEDARDEPMNVKNHKAHFTFTSALEDAGSRLDEAEQELRSVSKEERARHQPKIKARRKARR